MHKIIALDIDNCLYPWSVAVYNELYIHNKVGCTYDEFWRNHVQMYNHMWWDNMCKVDFLYSTQIPRKEELDFLKEISKTYKIYYITSRPIEVKLTTEQYLNRYEYPQRENLIFTKEKGLVCNSLGVTFMLEDQPHHIKDLIGAGVETVIMNQIWNEQAQFSCKRINNLLELRSILC